MYYVTLKFEPGAQEWEVSYTSGSEPEVDGEEALAFSPSRYGEYTIIKSNTAYWVVGSTLKVRKP
jgi:hypothetical protein